LDDKGNIEVFKEGENKEDEIPVLLFRGDRYKTYEPRPPKRTYHPIKPSRLRPVFKELAKLETRAKRLATLDVANQILNEYGLPPVEIKR